jgi:hypothetical protein
MSDHDPWFYDLDESGTRGRIVDAEDFTVLELRTYWLSLQPLLERLCRDHNRQQRSQAPGP